MSEYSPNQFGHLHVLRHHFQTNPLLLDELRPLIKEGRRFDGTVHSTKEAYVESAAYSLEQYHDLEQQALEKVHEWQRRPIVIAQVALRLLTPQPPQLPLPDGEQLQATKLRIALLPRDTNAFQSLASSLDIFPDMYPRKEPPRHYVYTDVPMAHLADMAIDETERSEFVERLQNKLSETALKQLYTVKIDSQLGGSEVVRPMEVLRPGWREPVVAS